MPNALHRERQNRRFIWWYDVIIDWMLANPGSTYTECARFFKKSPTTISLIVNSDAFKAKLAIRRQAQREKLSERIVEQTTSVAAKALELVNEKLETSASRITVADAMHVADLALARLGYHPPNTGAQVTVNQHTSIHDNRTLSVARDVLTEARSKLRANEAQSLPPPREEPRVEEPTPVEKFLELAANK